MANHPDIRLLDDNELHTNDTVDSCEVCGRSDRPTGDQLYSTLEFILPASDERGNSERLSVRLPPQLKHQIDVIIAEKRFPYTFSSDVARHAIYRHVQWLLELEHDIESYIPQIDAMAELLTRIEMHQRFQETIDRADRILVDLLQSEPGRKEALKILNQMKLRVMDIEDSYFRNRFKAEIDRRYEDLWDAGGVGQEEISLLPEDAEDY